VTRRKSMMELVEDQSTYTPTLESGDDPSGTAAGESDTVLDEARAAVEAADAVLADSMPEIVPPSTGKSWEQQELAIEDPKPLDWNEGAKLFARHSRLSNEESRLKAEAKFIKAELEIAALDLANWGRRLRQQHPVSVEEDPVFGVPQAPVEPTSTAGTEETAPVDSSVPAEAIDESPADAAPHGVDFATGEVVS
jgi:hypothetical protein